MNIERWNEGFAKLQIMLADGRGNPDIIEGYANRLIDTAQRLESAEVVRQLVTQWRHRNARLRIGDRILIDGERVATVGCFTAVCDTLYVVLNGSGERVEIGRVRQMPSH